MTYTVRVKRTLVERATFTVEASSEAEAWDVASDALQTGSGGPIEYAEDECDSEVVDVTPEGDEP